MGAPAQVVSTRPITGPDQGAIGRALFVQFFRREATTRYLGSVSGLAWALIHPVALLGVYHFVFTSIFRATGSVGTSFLAFVAVALWPWVAAQEAIQRAAVCVPAYGGLIRKVAFPHEVVVYASVAGTLAIHFVGYIVVLAVLRAFGKEVWLVGLVAAIPLWMIMAIAVAGISLALASLQVFVRDVEHVLMPVLMMLMYLTPVLYPLSLVPANLRGFVAANPFTWLVDRMRAALLEGQLAPRLSDVVALAVAVAIFLAGRWMFRRLSPHFEDFV